MKILLLGGTGAMGTPLQKILLDNGNEVHVTSRKPRNGKDVIWHTGNAHNEAFVTELMLEKYDAVVDFMSYKTAEFKQLSGRILPNTGQYIFISSARVYACSDSLLTENSPRLLDACNDQEYLKTEEYALTKARQENILFDSKHKNWTIIRPSLTYNDERLQYAMGEKEIWLYRALIGKKVVFPKNLANVYTTMSHGNDVAQAISLLIGMPKAISEPFHIAGAEPITWAGVNKIYNTVLAETSHVKIDFFAIDDWVKVSKNLNYYQMKYARAISRRFDNSKLKSIIGGITFRSPQAGLSDCLNNFISSGAKFRKKSWKAEALFDHITGDFGHLDVFSRSEKMKYLIVRYFPMILNSK